MRFSVSSVCTAFATLVVGTKVIDAGGFFAALAALVEEHDHSFDKAPGQSFITFPPESFKLVSAGVGPSSTNPSDYILREWRGGVYPFLRREFAEEVTFLACVVYTREAYLADPDITDDEHARICDEKATHVLVAVLAGSQSPLTPVRFVHNLAGGNNEAKTWSADEIRAKATEVAQYWADHAVVSD